MPNEANRSDRRYTRIGTPKGVWVAWQDGTRQEVSRVQDLNIGGMFIATLKPASLGAFVTLLLSVPEGEIRGKAVVRNVADSKGMGVEFIELSEKDGKRLQSLIGRLLGASENVPG